MDKLLASLEARLAKHSPTREQLELYLALLARKGLDLDRLTALEKEVKALRLFAENLAAVVTDMRNMMGVGI